MRLVLSRKGFDSSAGGRPSPILPDGTLVPLPMPLEAARSVAYGNLRAGDTRLGQLVQDLTGGKFTSRDLAHVDPDLCEATLRGRRAGWRPLFGQGNAAQRHLAAQGVGPGDLFLFFGWFRQAERHDDRYRFVRGAPDLHVVFGWLQVADPLPGGMSGRGGAPSWARYHTHFHNDWPSNTVYLSRRSLQLPGLRRRLPGGGAFKHFSSGLCLTAPGESRSVWKLPRFFAPADSRPILSYHHNPRRWTPGRDCCYLRSVGRGQEFVVDSDLCPDAVAWAVNLVESNG
jgi:hypothetical protein